MLDKKDTSEHSLAFEEYQALYEKSKKQAETIMRSAFPEIRPGQTDNLAHDKKSGYVQDVCECLSIVGGDKTMSNKILAQMNVTKDTAKKYADPETYRALERTVFAPKHEQKLERKQDRGL